TQPRHLEPGRGDRPTVHHLHPCVCRVERDACVEVAHRQCHMGKAAIDHHSPPLDGYIHCCSCWCTSMAKRSPGYRGPLMCTARTSASLMIRTTLAPKLGVVDQRQAVHARLSSSTLPTVPSRLGGQRSQSPP